MDQASKIQLGALQIDLESSVIPDNGKMHECGDSNFIISSGRKLLLVDII
jgi:hypothetical protein